MLILGALTQKYVASSTTTTSRQPDLVFKYGDGTHADAGQIVLDNTAHTASYLGAEAFYQADASQSHENYKIGFAQAFDTSTPITIKVKDPASDTDFVTHSECSATWLDGKTLQLTRYYVSYYNPQNNVEWQIFLG